MNAKDALRFVEHEASWCRDRDTAEALCLLLPPLLTAMGLEPMDSFEAEQFRRELKAWLKEHPTRDIIQEFRVFRRDLRRLCELPASAEQEHTGT